ncbi:small acid-soluble spore protein Tlp [Bacillus megaterium]|nr:small acid-soluble spore protein Tlp [Priestia megaterium]
MPRPKPDDRSDNVEKLQDMVQNTIENIEKPRKRCSLLLLKSGANPRENRRREEAIAAMRAEIKDEAAAREHGYQ